MASIHTHRALQCYDILYCIFDLLGVSERSWYDYDVPLAGPSDWYTRSNVNVQRSTLARCARVCKAFFSPAVAALWRDLDNFSPLISALTHEQSSWSQELHSRFNEYAAHVRVVDAIGTPLSPLKQNALAELPGQDAAMTHHLLPRVTHLRFIQFVPGGTELLQIVPPTLRHIHIIFRRAHNKPVRAEENDRTSSEDVFVQNLLSELVHKVPALRYIRVSTAGDIKESFLEPIGGFAELESCDVSDRVYCKALTAPLILSLAPLSNLRHVKLRLPAEMPSSVPLEAFSALETATLDAMFASLHVVSSFLSLVSSTQVRSLVLQNCDCTVNAATAGLHTLCEVIRTRFPSLTKLELSLRGNGTSPTHLKDTRPFVFYFEPLLDVHSLTDVRISMSPEVVIVSASSHDLTRMAEAWPKTTRLHLSCSPSTMTPTLTDVLALARSCPGLTDLVIPAIDASTPKSAACPCWDRPDRARKSASDSDGGGQTHGLRSFCLSDNGWGSRIPDPIQLAGFLDGVFPLVDWRCPSLASENWRDTVHEVVRLRLMKML